jgi:hypothetical protein
MESVLELLGAVDWRRVALWLGGLSAGLALVSALAIPPLLAKLPADYFRMDPPRLVERVKAAAPLMKLALLGKNLLGAIFLVLGLAMLFMPGQGVLTALVGLAMLDLPGKRRLERRLVSQAVIRQSINKLRARWDQPPLVLPDEEERSAG